MLNVSVDCEGLVLSEEAFKVGQEGSRSRSPSRASSFIPTLTLLFLNLLLNILLILWFTLITVYYWQDLRMAK